MDLHKFGSDVHVWDKIICSNFWDPFFIYWYSFLPYVCFVGLSPSEGGAHWGAGGSAERKRSDHSREGGGARPGGAGTHTGREASTVSLSCSRTHARTHAWNCMYKDPNLSLNSTPISYFLKQTQMSSLLRIFLIHSFTLWHIWTYDEKTYGQTYLKLHKNSFWHS